MSESGAEDSSQRQEVPREVENIRVASDSLEIAVNRMKRELEVAEVDSPYYDKVDSQIRDLFYRLHPQMESKLPEFLKLPARGHNALGRTDPFMRYYHASTNEVLILGQEKERTREEKIADLAHFINPNLVPASGTSIDPRFVPLDGVAKNPDFIGLDAIRELEDPPSYLHIDKVGQSSQDHRLQLTEMLEILNVAIEAIPDEIEEIDQTRRQIYELWKERKRLKEEARELNGAHIRSRLLRLRDAVIEKYGNAFDKAIEDKHPSLRATGDRRDIDIDYTYFPDFLQEEHKDEQSTDQPSSGVKLFIVKEGRLVVAPMVEYKKGLFRRKTEYIPDLEAAKDAPDSYWCSATGLKWPLLAPLPENTLRQVTQLPKVFNI